MQRVIVITGGSSGIGFQLSQLYKNEFVYLMQRTNPNSLPNFIKCDVSNEDDVVNAFKQIENEKGKIDILINNAGVGLSGASELLNIDEVKKVIDVNFYGVFFCCKHCIPLMHKKGKIINISSVIALFPRPFHTIYSASKAAVTSFSNGLRMELASTNIQVTAIHPTGIDSNFSKNRIYEYKTNDNYNQRIEKANNSVVKRKRMSVEKCALEIKSKIEKKKLKPNYVIGNSFKVLYFLQRFFPLNWILKITNNKFGGMK